MKTRKVTCIDCGWERTIRDRSDELPPIRCRSCNMKRLAGKGWSTFSDKCYVNGYWKGGRKKCANGYVGIKLTPDHPFYDMADSRDHYIYEHRLVMAQQLGYSIPHNIDVHHKNKVTGDNDCDNLLLVHHSRHPTLHRKH